MTRFSEEAWRRTSSVREAIHALPFNAELALGLLSRERFQTYVIQDALYLAQFSRALAIAAARAPDTATMQSFAQSALGAVTVEQALHRRYLRDLGVDPASIGNAEPSPDCLAYTNFLIAAAYHRPWEVLVAAVLPCFWIYWDVGCTIARKATPENPYRAWIDTYADEHFGEAVQRVIAVSDRAAEATTAPTRAEMLAAFARACQYEWLFWDGAYRRRSWPPIEFGT
jgi:thiaminase/transcriptional activator TenA